MHFKVDTDLDITVERATQYEFSRGTTVFIAFTDTLFTVAGHFTPKEAQDFALSILAELNDQGYGLDALE